MLFVGRLKYAGNIAAKIRGCNWSDTCACVAQLAYSPASHFRRDPRSPLIPTASPDSFELNTMSTNKTYVQPPRRAKDWVFLLVSVIVFATVLYFWLR